MRFKVKVLLVGFGAWVALMFVSGSSAHLRYSCSTEYDPYGICEHFRGYTTATTDVDIIDPINVVWYPNGTGGWSQNVDTILSNQWGWTHTCGSDQHVYRTLGADPDVYWANDTFQSQRGSNGCPVVSECWYNPPPYQCDRFHARVFEGHAHESIYDEWSVSDAHHEDASHNIDRSWEEVEDVFLQNAANWGRGREDYYTYLPLADREFQGYPSDGWAIRIASGTSGSGCGSPSEASNGDMPIC